MDPTGPPAEGDVNLGLGIIASVAVTTTACIFAVVLRFWVRGRLVKAIGWDDWTILLALIGTVIGTALDFVEVHEGFGRPQFYLNQHQLREFRKYTYGEWLQTFATLMFTKISICIFLMRIPTAKALIRPLQAAIVGLIVSNIILTVLWIVQCRPLEGAWNTDVESKCFSRGQLQRIIMAQAVMSAVSDFAFAAFPILILWRVQMALKSKIALCVLMGLGVVTGACCIVRTTLNWQAIPKYDYTYGGLDNWFWRLFEVQLGIIAASIPALRPGYKWLTRKALTLRSGNGGTTLLLGKSSNKQLDFENSNSRTKDSSSKKRSNWTEIEGEDIALPEYCQIRKTTDVDVEREAMRDSLGLGFRPDFKTSVGVDRSLERTIPEARQYHNRESF
ncbi:hypothetical protein OEA41_001994 [Lepraria neglecta]|uniref:Rhodopsin domain-containing protein n=1 Tax=Lepraria neglecta TaxID=209136 RepID=A0AAD9ZE29_9LECA|nr:hypothetical protein OEA41_001994 [Lepraria neglecta]